MTSSWMNRLGNWNPQLLREYRGRLRPRSLFAAIALSLMVQLILGLISWQSYQVGNANAWGDLFKSLTWIIVYALYFAGGYIIVNDLTQEEKRGTLNFIRLSPRPSHTILLGKILGAPLLAYVSVALAVPLHVISAIASGTSFGFIISYYLLLISGGCFLFSLGLLFAMLSHTRAFLGSQQSASAVTFAAFTALFFTPSFMGWNLGILWGKFAGPFRNQLAETTAFQWVYIPLARNLFIAHAFTLINLAIATFIVWRVVMRRFQNPNATVMSKRQGYAMVAYLELLVLGFYIRPDINAALDSGAFVLLYLVNFFLFLVLIATLSPQRQALLDWARFERSPGHLWRDLIWAEKSPAPVAIALCLCLSAALIIPWLFLVVRDPLFRLQSLPITFSFTAQILILSLVAQMILARKLRNPEVWANGAIATMLLLPAIILGILSETVPEPVQVYLWAIWGLAYLDWSNIILAISVLLGLVTQWLILIYLVFQLVRQMRRLSVSDRP